MGNMGEINGVNHATWKNVNQIVTYNVLVAKLIRILFSSGFYVNNIMIEYLSYRNIRQNI